MKKLKDIIECDYNIPIQDIKTDSREVKKGDLFVAVKGFNIDHSLYIDDAIKNGAHTLQEVQNVTGAAKGCGQCKDFLNCLIRDIKEEMNKQ